MVPVSLGGANDDENLQTLCRDCNRGKGNDASLNKEREADLCNVLDSINPTILRSLQASGTARVVANTDEYQRVSKLVESLDSYQLEVLSNTIIGYHAGFNMGIYTLNDNHGAKANFVIHRRGGSA